MTLQTPISYSGNPVRVTVSPEVGPSRVKIITPTGTGLTTLGALKRRAEEIVHNDPFVQSLMRDYGARIVPGSIKPA